MRGAASRLIDEVVHECNFYSRASCEARRSIFFKNEISTIISTHAPHARRGKMAGELGFSEQHFYSRASCEARL